MNAHGFVILGYAVGLGLLWGYALLLWWESRGTRRRTNSGGGLS